MQQNGNHIYGDLCQVDGLTKHWPQVDLSVREFDMDFDSILSIAQQSDGLFADLCDDIEACLRFQFQEDANRFVELYYSYEAA
jgi:hypothetical protein